MPHDRPLPHQPPSGRRPRAPNGLNRSRNRGFASHPFVVFGTLRGFQTSRDGCGRAKLVPTHALLVGQIGRLFSLLTPRAARISAISLGLQTVRCSRGRRRRSCIRCCPLACRSSPRDSQMPRACKAGGTSSDRHGPRRSIPASSYHRRYTSGPSHLCGLRDCRHNR